MHIRDLLNPDAAIRFAFRGFASMMFILMAVHLVTRVFPCLGPLLVGFAIAYVLYRLSVGKKRSAGARWNTGGAERTPIMPPGRGGA